MSRELEIALVCPKHQHLYMNSPSFHAAVTTLAKMLPAWVDGLAHQCEELDAALSADEVDAFFIKRERE